MSSAVDVDVHLATIINPLIGQSIKRQNYDNFSITIIFPINFSVNYLTWLIDNNFVYRNIKNREKCWSELPKSQTDVFKSLILSDQQSKIQKCSISSDILAEESKLLKINFWQLTNSDCVEGLFTTVNI